MRMRWMPNGCHSATGICGLMIFGVRMGDIFNQRIHIFYFLNAHKRKCCECVLENVVFIHNGN